MRLYVTCRHCGQKIYFNSSAVSRSQLPPLFQLKCQNFYCNHAENFTSQDVIAEPGLNATNGAVLGGLLGLLGGPQGAAIGAVIGAGIGGKREADEKEVVERFNRGGIWWK